MILVENKTKKSIAFWRNPNQSEIYTTGVNKCVISTHQQEFQQSGFVFKPFEYTENSYYFIPFEKGFPQQVHPLELSDIVLRLSNYNGKETQLSDYLSAFEQSMGLLQKNDLQKIVLSRTKQTDLINEGNAVLFFKQLTQHYPQAFVYLLFHPEVGCWVGATPEPLLIHQDENYQTVALAASKKNTKESHVKWSDKEKEEQAYVSDYIREYLQKKHISFSESLPTSTPAGNVIHLKTIFTIPKKEMNPYIADFIHNIHPTPAVCGLPKQQSFKKILSYETHKRELYSGYIGTVKENNVSVFVNLRCMRIFSHEALLYAGGGLTKDSNAAAEWQETELKTETLLHVAKQME